VLAVDRIINKSNREIGRGRFEASTSRSSASHPQVDELNKMVKTFSADMEKMKFEGKQGYKFSQNGEIRGNFRSRDKEDQKIQTPLQNNLMVD
jgi:hypothetical protein